MLINTSVHQIIMILAGISVVLTAYTQKITIKGTVTEAETSEPLALVSVTVSSASKKWHETTNQHGYFQLTIDKEATQVLFSQVGYEPYQAIISSDTLLVVRLKRYTLQEVEVKTSYQPASSPNLVSLSPSRLNQLPNIGREKDIIKAVSYTHLDVYKRQTLHRAGGPVDIFPRVNSGCEQPSAPKFDILHSAFDNYFFPSAILRACVVV